MSKIFDAYKKQSASALDIAQEEPQLGFDPLYPPPKEEQLADFSRLANRLLGLKTGPDGSVFCFASTTSGEGASFVSYNTAVVLAQVYNQKVAWVDCNILSPQSSLQVDTGLTFSTLLKNPTLVQELHLNGNPYLLAGGSDLRRSKGLFASANFTRVLTELAQRFDQVILDLPPVLDTSDTALMAAGCDGFLLVIEQQYLKWEIVSHGLNALRDKGVQILGSVVNRRKFVLPKIIYDRL